MQRSNIYENQFTGYKRTKERTYIRANSVSYYSVSRCYNCYMRDAL